MKAGESLGRYGLVLLCFEMLAKPGQWCHRRLFPEFWEHKMGRAVLELGAEPAG